MAPAASTRWCPTPEQVMILEEMYRSGVRTPNAAQIQQITAHLSLYGKIEGKNVFYWFQNHKARDRQKLRKKLLGKQLHQHHHYQQQQQHLLFSHHLFPPFDHHNYFHHHFTNNNNNSNNYHHFDQPPPSLPPPPPTPPVAPPCCGSTASSPGLFNQLPPANSSHCLTAHQARAVDVVPRMTNTYTWNMETNSEAKYGTRENAMKPMMTMLTNNDHHHHHHDWMMMRKSSGDYHYHHHHHDSHNYNVDDDDDSRRSIKTLELFPIKDKTSLKEDNNNNI